MKPDNDNNPISGNIRFSVEPRLVPPTKAARRLHLTLSEFDAKREALYRSGFPAPCDITGNYDLHAIEAWQDNRSGLASPAVTTSNAAGIFAARLAAIG
ncbi:hypothetical protein [Mesorhizobium sp. LjNodule214]|uniref:hypothetical protein n=1 Tax=Mesorhizobium sp. LjNodule214 TaxID=3342252 RepID=UPI003ECD29DC